MRSIGIEDVDISNISWDALSYKIPPTASEYFCQILPHFSDQLSQAQLSIIDEM